MSAFIANTRMSFKKSDRNNSKLLKHFMTLSDGFVSKTMKPVHRREVTISPSGERTYTDLPEPNITVAELILPPLKERASRSTISHLYELSMELLDSGDEDNTNKETSTDVELIDSEVLTDIESRKVECYYNSQLNMEDSESSFNDADSTEITEIQPDVETQQIGDFNDNNKKLVAKNEIDSVSNLEPIDDKQSMISKIENSEAELTETDTLKCNVECRKVQSYNNINYQMSPYNEMQAMVMQAGNRIAVQRRLQFRNEESKFDSSSTTTAINYPILRKKKVFKRQPKRQNPMDMEVSTRTVVQPLENKATPMAWQACKNVQPAQCLPLGDCVGNYLKSALLVTRKEYSTTAFLISLLLFFLKIAYACVILWHDFNDYLHLQQEYRKLVTESGAVMKIYYYLKYFLAISDTL